MAYSYTDPADRTLPWHIQLLTTDDGIHYRPITPLPLDGHPNETTLRFDAAGRMIALVRREELGKDHAYLGISSRPFHHWDWRDTGLHLGGPNFILDNQERVWIGGRVYQQEEEATGLLTIKEGEITPLLILESGGDTGYPGMVIQNQILWMSYYSSHEGKSYIYLAKIQLPKKA